MCQQWVKRLRAWDRRGALEYVAYQDPGVPSRFPWIPESAFSHALQLVAPNGETWEGAGAAEKLTTLLPGGGPLSLLFRIPLARPVADRVYRWVADNRGTRCEVHSA
jgi:predicted DCC family thiol-disulfide oxidoreductase YuxK